METEVKKYTNPRHLLTPAETGLFDLMLNTSELLKLVAEEGIDELADQLRLDIEGEEGWTDVACEGLHKMLTYVFTLGVQFAVQRQQEVALEVAKKMGLVEGPNTN